MTRAALICFLTSVPFVHLNRGELEEARRARDRFSNAEESDDVQERALHATGAALLAAAEGRHEEAWRLAKEAFEARHELGLGEMALEAFIVAATSAYELGDTQSLEELLQVTERMPPGRRPRFLEAHALRFRVWLAVSLLEHAECLIAEGRAGQAPPLQGEAREIFERLKARPWLERLEKLARAEPVRA